MNQFTMMLSLWGGERTDLATDVAKLKGKTSDLVAKDFGISGRTYDRIFDYYYIIYT